MSVKFEIDEDVRVKRTISNGTPKQNARPYQNGWVFASKGDMGKVVKQEDNESYTVYFYKSDTAAIVNREDMSKV